MLLKNISTEQGLVNGARGTVIGFEKSSGRTTLYPVLPVVKFSTLVGGERQDTTLSLTPESWEIKLGEV